MGPIKLKLGSIPKGAQTQITPVPGSPPSLLGNGSVSRPTAVGAKTSAVSSPKAKKPGDIAKSVNPDKGVGKLRSFIDNRAGKKNKNLNK